MKLIAFSLATLGCTVHSGRPVLHDEPLTTKAPEKKNAEGDAAPAESTPPVFIAPPGTYTVYYGPKGNGDAFKPKLREKELLTVGCDLSFNKARDGIVGENTGHVKTDVSQMTCKQADQEFHTDYQWSDPKGLEFYVDDVEAKDSRECLTRKYDKDGKLTGLDGSHYDKFGHYWGRVQYKLKDPIVCKGLPTPGTYKVEYNDGEIDFGEQKKWKTREKKLKIGCDLKFTNDEGPTTGSYHVAGVETECSQGNFGKLPDSEKQPDDFDAVTSKKETFFVNGLFGEKNRECLYVDHDKDATVIKGVHYSLNAESADAVGFYARVRYTLETKLECKK